MSSPLLLLALVTSSPLLFIYKHITVAVAIAICCCGSLHCITCQCQHRLQCMLLSVYCCFISIGSCNCFATVATAIHLDTQCATSLLLFLFPCHLPRTVVLSIWMLPHCCFKKLLSTIAWQILSQLAALHHGIAYACKTNCCHQLIVSPLVAATVTTKLGCGANANTVSTVVARLIVGS